MKAREIKRLIKLFFIALSIMTTIVITGVEIVSISTDPVQGMNEVDSSKVKVTDTLNIDSNIVKKYKDLVQ